MCSCFSSERISHIQSVLRRRCDDLVIHFLALGMHIFRHIYDNQDDGHCIVLEAEDRVIVSFGGTRQGSMKNWKANFRFNQVKWSEMFEPLSVVRYSGTDELQGSELSTKKSIFNQVAEEVKTFNEIKASALHIVRFSGFF